MELITVIALLCQTPNSSVQLSCQKYYINCVDRSNELVYKLKKCILNK